MDRPVVIYGSPLLRKKAMKIESVSGIELLAKDMFQTLKKRSGIGLAGPQIGILKNIFIVDTSPFENEGIKKVEKVYINPEILNFNGGEIYFNEGCLSIPEIFEDVKRPQKIHVRYRDISYRLQEETLDGIVARIFQHENDHLNGILFIDRLPAIRRRIIRKNLNRIAKENFNNKKESYAEIKWNRT